MVVPLNINMKTSLLTKRGHNQVSRLTNRTVLERNYQREIWPQHFRNNGKTAPGGAYGYLRRSQRWQKFKERKYGHNRPLYATGKLQRTLFARSKVTATANRARLYSKGYYPMTADRRREIEVVTRSEVNQMGRWWKTNYIRLARSKRFQTVRRKR